jgi:RHS repeat-associated protein
MWYLDDSEPAPILIDLTTTESEIADTQIEIVVPIEPEGDVLDYIVDVATTKRSLNNGPDIARHCIQQGQTSVHLNNLPLNGTNIYVRVWSKRANGDWVYEDYELETEAKTPATKQITRSYIVADHLDTPRFIYDDEKALTWRWASDGFGRQAANDDPDGDGYQVNFNLGFPGQYEDLESGLVYNWNRYYDSEIGRYVTSDPIGLDGGLNTFGYVGGNSLNSTDPEGLAQVCWSWNGTWPHKFLCVGEECAGKWPWPTQGGHPSCPGGGMLSSEEKDRSSSSCRDDDVGKTDCEKQAIDQCVLNNFPKKNESICASYDAVSNNCIHWVDDVIASCRALAKSQCTAN